MLGMGSSTKQNIIMVTLVIFVSLKPSQCNTSSQLCRRPSLVIHNETCTPVPKHPSFPHFSEYVQVFIDHLCVLLSSPFLFLQNETPQIAGPFRPKPVTPTTVGLKGLGLRLIQNIRPQGLKGRKMMRRELVLKLGLLSIHSDFT